MRVISRELQISRSESIQRCRQVAIAISLALSIAACGGGGGGGGGSSAPVQQAPQNATPTVQAGTDQTIEWPSATAQLTGSATDDSSTTLTYAWSATSGPSGVTFGTANAAATSVTFPAAGSYVLTLSVGDGTSNGTDTVSVTVSPAVYPASDANNDTVDHGWTRVAAAADVGLSQAHLDQAAAYAQTSGRVQPNSAGMIVRKGRLVHSWGDIDRRFDLKSTTKSIGGMALGLALANNTLQLTDLASTKLTGFGETPASNITTGYLPSITIQQLATHTAGFDKPQGYPALLRAPGTAFFYSDGGLNWLADILTTTFGQDLATVLSTNVWATLGVNSSVGGTGNNGTTTSDVHWRDNQSLRTNPQFRELASGIYANANTMARVGLLFLRKGVWANDQRVLSEDFVSKVHTPAAVNTALANPQAAEYPGAPAHYGMLWWTNVDGQLPNVPRDAFWGWGLGDSLIVVIPSLDLVVVRAGAVVPGATDPDPGVRVWNDWDWNGDYTVLAPFLDPIVQSVSQ